MWEHVQPVAWQPHGLCLKGYIWLISAQWPVGHHRTLLFSFIVWMWQPLWWLTLSSMLGQRCTTVEVCYTSLQSKLVAALQACINVPYVICWTNWIDWKGMKFYFNFCALKERNKVQHQVAPPCNRAWWRTAIALNNGWRNNLCAGEPCIRHYRSFALKCVKRGLFSRPQEGVNSLTLCVVPHFSPSLNRNWNRNSLFIQTTILLSRSDNIYHWISK